MRIAIISPIRHPISAPFMGGMEAHSYALAGALVARGHEVTLFASGDSQPPEGVELYPVTEQHVDSAYPSKGGRESDVPDTHLDSAFAGILQKLETGGFDIIHNNSLHRYPPRLARRERIAMLTSLHVPPLETLRDAVHDARAPWCRFTVCTGAQRERWAKPDCDLSFHVVPNGIDTGVWGFCPHADGSAVWFGRITPNKGTAEAVKAARIAEVPLRIYGPIEDRAYFDDTIAPYLGSQITYGGNLTAEDLSAEVARASVCFFTPVWDEPFGLAAAEAMSCGVPVAAFDSGAVREVVGEAGVIVPTGDVAALASAARKAMTCDRQFVRDRAIARFGVERMVDRYEELYRMCMAGLSEPAPEVDFAPDDLPPAEVGVRLAVE
ncbi:glycosyltransferase [Thioclava sp. F28-4]|uniref:glycosyltransferase n=1 Tax=Thioclava sp. F28-4 TaxID=1915315 RepID=UPI00143A47D1|nr:glycosyltransferase [Thioclava sp. F28-4]